MNRIAKFAAPAALAFAVFGAQAEGFTPSAGGQFAGPTVVTSVPSVPAATAAQHEAYTPVAGGQFMPAAEAPMLKATMRTSPAHLDSVYFGA